MAKKNKPRPKPRVSADSTPAPKVEKTIIEEPAPAAAPEPRPARTPKISRSQAASERLEDEYAFIIGDLRRVFILAAAMFALLIILNIILSNLGA
jgi:hypothetical protein